MLVPPVMHGPVEVTTGPSLLEVWRRGYTGVLLPVCPREDCTEARRGGEWGSVHLLANSGNKSGE
jgi:hypothetical protein